MDILVYTHQIQFPVLHFNMDFAGKICAGELPEILLRNRYLIRPRRMFRFFSIKDFSDAFSQPVLVQRFIIGKNDDNYLYLASPHNHL